MPKYVRKYTPTYRKRATYTKRRTTSVRRTTSAYRKRPAARRPTTYRKRGATAYRRRTAKRSYTRSGRNAQQMQDSTFQYVKKKYTFVTPINVGAGLLSAATTVSIMGGCNATNPNDTVTLGKVDPDGMATKDMQQYQHFKITGCNIKLFFPEGTTPAATPISWAIAYSGSQVINPQVADGPIRALSTFQTSSCDSSHPVTRYFVPNKQLQNLGIDWCSTKEYADFATAAVLYGGQLPVNSGSSLYLKVNRTTSSTAAALGRLQVTYYVTYRGVKGSTDIV